jgi:DNA-binding transcriptional MerR regulator
MSEKTTYSIRELEEMSGIPAHTIRTWERRYGLLSPVRDAGNSRCYAREVVGYLRHLAILLRQGHRISALASKSVDEIHALVQELHPPHPEELTESICHALREYNASRVESLLECYFKKEGFDQALSERFIPFLEQSGFLLLSGVLKPMHMQIFCTILRQKLFAAAESIHVSKQSEVWLLLHGKADTDTVHRDILHYLLRKGGRNVVRLDVAGHADISEMIQSIRPVGACLVADGGFKEGNLIDLAESIAAQQGNTLVFTPGKTLDFANSTQIPAISVIRGLKDAFRYL